MQGMEYSYLPIRRIVVFLSFQKWYAERILTSDCLMNKERNKIATSEILFDKIDVGIVYE